MPTPNNAHPTTVPGNKTAPSTIAAKLANSPTGSADPPSRTVDAGRDPIAPSSDAGELATPANQADTSSPDNSNPANGSVDPQNHQDDSVTLKHDDTEKTSIDPKGPSWLAHRQGDSLESPTPGLRALIYNAFDKSGPGISEVGEPEMDPDD